MAAGGARLQWTTREEQKMLEFLVLELRTGNPEAEKPAGYGLWMTAAARNITPHSYSSMQTKMSRKLLPGILRNSEPFIAGLLTPEDLLYVRLRLGEVASPPKIVPAPKKPRLGYFSESHEGHSKKTNEEWLSQTSAKWLRSAKKNSDDKSPNKGNSTLIGEIFSPILRKESTGLIQEGLIKEQPKKKRCLAMDLDALTPFQQGERPSTTKPGKSLDFLSQRQFELLDEFFEADFGDDAEILEEDGVFKLRILNGDGELIEEELPPIEQEAEIAIQDEENSEDDEELMDLDEQLSSLEQEAEALVTDSVEDLNEEEMSEDFFPSDIPSKKSVKEKAQLLQLPEEDLNTVLGQFQLLEQIAVRYRTPYQSVIRIAQNQKDLKKVEEAVIKRKGLILKKQKQLD